MLLLDRGESKKSIGEMLGLPTGMTKRYINDVQSKLARAKIQRAADSVTEGGLTVAKAAEEYGVDADKLKEALSGHRRSHKTGVAEMQRQLTQTYKSVSQRNAALLRSLIEKYDEGDVSAKQAKDIFEHVEKCQRQSSRSVHDWKKRFEGKSGKPLSAEKPE